MGLLPPPQIKPFSKEFAELFYSMIDEINRMAKSYQDLSRASKQVFTSSGGGKGSEIVFFKIASHEGDDVQWSMLGGSGNEPQKYIGTIQIYNSSSVAKEDESKKGDKGEGEEPPKEPEIQIPDPVSTISGCEGYDMRWSHNTPIDIPSNAELKADILRTGTVVMAQRLTEKVCIFSSVMPRVSVVCGDKDDNGDKGEKCEPPCEPPRVCVDGECVEKG